jgi:Kef-type K+ transport system membrane component KefB
VTDEQIQLLLADLAIIIALARLLGAAARKIGQPPVVGEIVAGILLGPTFFGGAITRTLFPADIKMPLSALANLGLVLFMFVVGYEVDLRLIRGRGRVAATVSVSSVILPLSLGAGLGVWLTYRYHVTDVPAFVLFIGIAMSVTAFPVLARILVDRGLHRTRIGGLALASAAVDDVLAWTLLAIVVALAGSGGHSERLAFIPLYAAVMIWGVRPLLRRLAGVYLRRGRLTPNVLAAVLIGLLASCLATDWMGIKFIFGAFVFGLIMPREGAGALREDILESLQQITVLVLLPVFFVVSGLSVNLSTVGLTGLLELLAILAVAIGGKFGGAYAGARLVKVPPRQAGVLAALMNTRGLTEIVILAIGLQLGVLSGQLYSLMIVMAIVTTAMAGPLLKSIYPPKLMERDIAEADRELAGEAPPHRILVLVDAPGSADALVDVGAGLAASRPHSEVVLAHLVPHRGAGRLEVGTGLGEELLQLTETMSELEGLAARARQQGVPAVVQSRFSENVTGELPAYIAAAAPDTIVLGPNGVSREALGADGTTQLVTVLDPPPAAPGAIAVHWTRGADGEAAVQVAAQLAVASQLRLVVAPAGGRRAALAASLARHGVAASDGAAPDGALLVGPAGDAAGAHLAVVAGTREASDDLEQWVAALDERRLV